MRGCVAGYHYVSHYVAVCCIEVRQRCDKVATKRCTKMMMRNLWYEKPRMGGMYLSTAHSGFWLKRLLMHRCI